MSVFIPRASGTPEVSPCRGPGATLRLVDDAFVVLGPGTGLAFETLDTPYDLGQVPPPALPAMLGCPTAQWGWQSRSDLETDKVHRPFVNGVRVRADPAQGQSGRDCGAVHVARFPFQIPLDVVMMLFITESKTM